MRTFSPSQKLVESIKLVVEATTQKGEIKRISDLVALSFPVSDFEEQKRDVIKYLKTIFSATSTPSIETKVLCDFAVAEMPFQPSCFFFNLSDFHICIFYPGGKLKVTVNSATRRHQIQFTSCQGRIQTSSIRGAKISNKQ
jgi:hypothetical protein